MSENELSFAQILGQIDSEIDRLKSELKKVEGELSTAECTRSYLIAVAQKAGTDGQIRPRTRPALSSRPSVGSTKGRKKPTLKQTVLDLAIQILKDRDNRPIQRDELWREMQARGLTLKNAHPTHYIASKVLGDAKETFANKNGYYLIGYEQRTP